MRAIHEHKKVEEAVRKAYAQTELLLASIPSILIGVNQDGLVSHWSAVAESTFGIPAGDVLNQLFSDCGIQWDFAAVLAGIRDCRGKARTIRLDDVRFRRPNGEEGFLGITILPMRQDPEGPIECVLFGADITERRKVEQLKDEFVSTVSHELRTPLTVIREGVSQVLEGILGKVNKEQEHFLSIALEGIDRLQRIVDELLDISKIEAGKLELKRELVDIVSLAKGVSGAFSPQAQAKGLALRTYFPKERVEIYADKDKAIQVLTNLIANALKFTEKGQIEIRVRDLGNSVECAVTDTGKGISPKDLPKVFTKFQQFTRVTDPTHKGTGLGLAISKGIVESHQGQIWVTSRPGEGTTFTFRLPRYSAKELFRDQVVKSLKEAMKQETSLSIIVFDIGNFERLQEKLGQEKISSLVHALEGVIKQNLRRKADVAIKDTRAILVLLPATEKPEALMVAGRIQQTFDDYLSKEHLQKEIQITCKVATFPEDGTTVEAVLAKVEAS